MEYIAPYRPMPTTLTIASAPLLKHRRRGRRDNQLRLLLQWSHGHLGNASAEGTTPWCRRCLAGRTRPRFPPVHMEGGNGLSQDNAFKKETAPTGVAVVRTGSCRAGISPRPSPPNLEDLRSSANQSWGRKAAGFDHCRGEESRVLPSTRREEPAAAGQGRRHASPHPRRSDLRGAAEGRPRCRQRPALQPSQIREPVAWIQGPSDRSTPGIAAARNPGRLPRSRSTRSHHHATSLSPHSTMAQHAATNRHHRPAPRDAMGKRRRSSAKSGDRKSVV